MKWNYQFIAKNKPNKGKGQNKRYTLIGFNEKNKNKEDSKIQNGMKRRERGSVWKPEDSLISFSF
jgi:hypothetical protein